jgi:hypothetical protein
LRIERFSFREYSGGVNDERRDRYSSLEYAPGGTCGAFDGGHLRDSDRAPGGAVLGVLIAQWSSGADLQKIRGPRFRACQGLGERRNLFGASDLNSSPPLCSASCRLRPSQPVLYRRINIIDFAGRPARPHDRSPVKNGCFFRNLPLTPRRSQRWCGLPLWGAGHMRFSHYFSVRFGRKSFALWGKMRYWYYDNQVVQSASCM